jgi:iron complex transport system permease protein
MSEFLSRSAPRALTGRRLALVTLGLLAFAAAVALVAIAVGVAHDRDGRHLQLLPWSALAGAGPEHQILWLRIGRVAAGFLVGAALALAAIWQMARVGQQLPPATLVLAGVVVSMFCSAASLLVQATADFTELSRMLRWMMGGLEGRRMTVVQTAAVPIAVGLVVVWAKARSLDALAAGEDAAASVGVAVGATQRVVLAAAAVLVGVSIALGGPIGFVGLVVPHALRALLGPDHRLLVPAAALGGGALVVACDLLARTVIAPAQLPTGAVTALLGGPFFLAILVAHKRKAGLWGAS